MTFRDFLLLIFILLLPGCSSMNSVNPDKKIISENPQEARILFSGDLMLDWGIQDTIIKEGAEYPLKNLKEFLHGFDYRFCNLECPITAKGEVHPDKKYVFRGKPEHIALLKYAEINGVSLANNHACDYGKTGLLDTIVNLTKNNIYIAGAGENIKSAHLPLTINVNNIKLAVLAYASVAYDDSFAGKNTPGIAMAKLELIKEDIKKHKPSFDFIIITIHWGDEYSEYPSDRDIKIAHQIINSGADAVIGHHPHIFQGIEIYEDKPIIYSLGNFVFGSVNEDARENIVVEISFQKNRIKSFRVFPLNGNGNTKQPFQYSLLKGAAASDSLNHLLNISKPLKSKFTQNAVIDGAVLSYTF